MCPSRVNTFEGADLVRLSISVTFELSASLVATTVIRYLLLLVKLLSYF